MIEIFAESWHAILYLVTPWQYPPRLGMPFYILSRLGSIRRGLACFCICYHALAVSAEAWHAFLYVIMPWQYQPRLGMLLKLFYMLSCLGSISQGEYLQKPNPQKPKLRKLKSKVKEQSRTAKAKAPKTRAAKAQVE